MQSRILLGTLMAALGLAPGAAAVSLRSGHGLRIQSVKRIDARLLAVTVRSSTLPGPAGIRILLPSGYARHPARRYPVLYLLHGTSGGAADWTAKGNAERTTSGRPLIVVMPDIALKDDGGGWCTNWPDGRYRWETFHIGQLLPWIDANLRTIRNRSGRAIAGLSQGGFCSMSYAARHPDLFSVALAYSGAPDIYYDTDARMGALTIINLTETALDHVPPDSMFGSPLTNGINYAAHDPATLAGNLRWTKLLLYSGNGLPGPYDHGPPNSGASVIEGVVSRDNVDFHRRLVALKISSIYDPYGPGTHSWPYWSRDLRWSIGPIMAAFAHPAPTPKRFRFQSAASQYALYGWRVTVHRAVREFSTLLAHGAAGFRLEGSGAATVTTPSDYRAGRRYRVTVRSQTGTRHMSIRADRHGRLTITVPLGRSNRTQEYATPGSTAGTAVYRTSVTVRS